MAKADAVFTIGADASAFSREAKKVEGQTHDFLTRLGGKFFGLQAIALGVQKAFAGLSAPLHAFGELENTQAQLAVMMDSKSAAESLTRSLQKLATNGVVSMQDLLAASRPLTHVMEGAAIFGELFNGAGGGFSSIRELVSSVIGALRPIATALAREGHRLGRAASCVGCPPCG